MKIPRWLLAPVLGLTLGSCTAEQWQTTKEVLAVTAVVAGAAAVGAAAGYEATHPTYYVQPVVVVPACVWSPFYQRWIC